MLCADKVYRPDSYTNILGYIGLPSKQCTALSFGFQLENSMRINTVESSDFFVKIVDHPQSVQQFIHLTTLATPVHDLEIKLKRSYRKIIEPS